MANTLLRQVSDGVAVLTLNRPDKRNALSRDLLTALREEVRFALNDDATTACVITGAPPAFCAGLDLDELPADGTTAVTPDVLYDLLYDIYTAPKPVLAAVNGDAVAGGAAIMSVCDLAIAARSARVGYPQIKRGLTAPIVMPFLIRQVGLRRAKRLLLTGELMTAEDACEAGLIDEVVDHDVVLTHALSWAVRLASHPPECFAETKQLIQEVQDEDVRSLFERCKSLERPRP